MTNEPNIDDAPKADFYLEIQYLNLERYKEL